MAGNADDEQQAGVQPRTALENSSHRPSSTSSSTPLSASTPATTSISATSPPTSTPPAAQSPPSSSSSSAFNSITSPPSDSQPPQFQDISRIAILGAGPVGLAFAHALVAESGSFTENPLDVTIYEQRQTVGGIWNLSSNHVSLGVTVPQCDRDYGTGVRMVEGVDVHMDVHMDGGGDVDVDGEAKADALEFESPLYEYLETNIPKQLMQFAGFGFSEKESLFPSHQAVLEYLERYADPVRSCIRFGVKVRAVRLLDQVDADSNDEGNAKDTWEIRSEDLQTGEVKVELFDAVVVANGHYTVPYVPDIKGIEEWNNRYPGVVLHSKAYRRPQDFNDKKVLVIGNSASGLDIAAQIGTGGQPKGKVLLSARSISAFGTAAKADWREDVDEVVEFLQTDRAVRFASGRVEKDLDAVIFATGYFYSYPFLNGSGTKVVDDGLRVKGLYEHLFQIEHPTLVFPVVNLKVIPFPLAQNQAAVVARVWSGRLDLPSRQEMKKWEEREIERKGDGKYFHLKKFPEDAAQLNQLYAWACEARGHGESHDLRFSGTRWDERLVWMRSRFPDIRAAYVKRGDERVKVTSMEELGFDFEKWRANATEEELGMFEQAGCRR